MQNTVTMTSISTSETESSLKNEGDISIGSNSSLDSLSTLTAVYLQHDDPDVIIPDWISLPLVFSSHLLLLSSIVGIVYKRYGIFAFCLFVYFTSIAHWRRPRFSTIARRLDFFAVFSAIVYGSYFTISLNSTTTLIVWFLGLAIIGIIFSTNEYLYYTQVMKTLDGSSTVHSTTFKSDLVSLDEVVANISHCDHMESNHRKRCHDYCSFDMAMSVTLPNTAHRDWVYKRTMMTHCLCVHIFANILVLYIVISSST